MEPVHAGGYGRATAPHAFVALLLATCLALSAAPARAEVPAEACPVSPSQAAASVPPANVPEAAPPSNQILVCVQQLSITGAVFRHWADVARRSEAPPGADHVETAAKKPGEHRATAKAVAEEVLGFLISSDWIIEEADALHIHLSARTVRHRFERVRAEQFRKPGEFGRFLTDSGQTAEDIMFRVKLNLLSMRIQRHVLAGRHGAHAQQQALSRFIRGFKGRWQARTYCTPSYAVVDCGHIVAPPL